MNTLINCALRPRFLTSCFKSCHLLNQQNSQDILKKILSAKISTTSMKMDTFNVQDEDDFAKRVLESSKPVVVDFHAEWCAPCKLLSPRLDAAISATDDKVDLALVDIDELGDLALEHDVQAVPTVLAISDGKEVDRFVGLIDEDKLTQFVDNLK